MNETPAAAVEAVASDEIMAELCGSIMAIRTEFGRLSDMQIAEIVWSRAYPLIRQATADEIAAKIEARLHGYRQWTGIGDPDETYRSGLTAAAGIARRVGGGGGGG